MRKLLLATTMIGALAGFTTGANATLLLQEETFADLGATGFGDAPRLLTLHNNGFEAGGTFATSGGGTGFTTIDGTTCTAQGSGNCASGLPDTGANESLVYSLQALKWTSGAEVGIGLDTNESQGGAPSLHGLSFDTLVLTLYDNTGTALGSFSGNGPVNITQAQLDQQQGNGNSVFNIGLSVPEQAEFDALIKNKDLSQIFEGLSASFGCTTGTPTGGGCPLNVSTDGAESFLAFQQSAVPGPIVGAGLPGIILGCMTMVGFARRRIKKRLGLA